LQCFQDSDELVRDEPGLFECAVRRTDAIEDYLPALIAGMATENRTLRSSMFAIVRMLLKSKMGMVALQNVSSFVELVMAVGQDADLMILLSGWIPCSS
jgi:hypothetical protein